MDSEVNNRTCEVIRDGRFVLVLFTLCIVFVALLLSFITDLKTQMTGKVHLFVLHCLCAILLTMKENCPGE